jgi:hypothetical protein
VLTASPDLEQDLALRAWLQATAEEAVSRVARQRLLPLHDALDPAGREAREAASATAEPLLSATQGALDALNSQWSYQLAQRTVSALERADLTHEFPRLVQALTLKLASEIANGDRAVRQDLESLIFLEARVELPANYFPPDELARATQLRQEASQVANGRLEVRTFPAGSSVYIDGRYQGLAPLTVTGLTPVDHYVSVTLPGYGFAQQRARGGSVSFTLIDTPGLGRYRMLQKRLHDARADRTRYALARSLAQQVAADQVLVLLLRPGSEVGKRRVDLVRLDAQGKVLATGEAELGTRAPPEAQVERALVSVLSHEEPKAKLPPEPFESVALASSGSEALTAGHVLLGAGAALVVGGVAFGSAALIQQHHYTNVVNSVGPAGVSVAQPYATRGKSYAVTSDLLNLAGLVSLGLGVYFTFFHPPAAPASTSVEVAPPPARWDR